MITESSLEHDNTRAVDRLNFIRSLILGIPVKMEDVEETEDTILTPRNEE